MKYRKPRRKVIKVLVEPYEKAQITANAKYCRLSISAYARTILLTHRPVNRIDKNSLDRIFKLHADLGRLGGLMKMLLTNKERLDGIGTDMALATIDGVLVDIRVTQDLLKQAVNGLLRKKPFRETGEDGSSA